MRCRCFCLQCKFALSLPRVLPRAFARSLGLAIEFAARVFTPTTYLPVLFATNVAIPRQFFPSMLPCRLPKPLPLPLLVPSRFAMVVAIKFGCVIEHRC